MVKVENECCDCGLPCIFAACPNFRVVRFYCDECGEEFESVYYFDGEELCINCIEKRLERVEHND